jgi:hypothetical protein
MPNECINNLTITSNYESDIAAILQEIKNKFPKMVIKQNKKLGMRIKFITPWHPDLEFIESIQNKYPSIFIKNTWISEDGNSGIWVAKNNIIKSMQWNDLSIEEESLVFNS